MRSATGSWVALAFALVVVGPMSARVAAQHEAEHKPEAKADPKADAKGVHQEAKPEARAEAKAQPKSEAKPEGTPAPKAQPEGAAKPQTKVQGGKPVTAEKPNVAPGRGASPQEVQAAIQRIRQHVTVETGKAAAGEGAPRDGGSAPAPRPASAPRPPAGTGHAPAGANERVTLRWRLSLNWAEDAAAPERIHLVWPR